MMLKITKIQESRRDVLIKLEGKITDQWAALLDGECHRISGRRKPYIWIVPMSISSMPGGLRS